jgi:cholesterol oxidase
MARGSAGAPSYQAIVIGSGYGGSVAALRLGECAVNTLVLERGRSWRVSDPSQQATFATLEDALSGSPAAGKGTWLNTRCVGNLYLSLLGEIACPRTTGILELVDGTPETHRDASPALKMMGIHGMCAAGVGGGSLVNNGVTFAPTEAGWRAAFPPDRLPHMQQVWEDLTRTYFAQARAGLAPELLPADLLAHPAYRGTRLMLEYAQAAGYPLEDARNQGTFTFGHALAPVIVDWAKVRQELAGERAPSITRGEAWWGNNSGARKSLDMEDGYLGRAIATGHVTVQPLSTVSAIEYDELQSLYIVHVTRTDEAYQVLETTQLSTPNLLLAAGSLGTAKLLVRARDTGTLPRLNRHVGTHFSTNGGTIHLGLQQDQEAMPQGGPAGIKINDFRDPRNPVVLENLPQRVPDLPALAKYRSALLLIGIGIPTGHGQFRYDASSDTVILDWPADAAHNVYARVTELYQAMFPESLAQTATLHPLGGAPLGLATDVYGRLLGYKRLYVLDGSLVPGASALANPSLLITAMAERCMSRIVGSIALGDDRWEDEA